MGLFTWGVVLSKQVGHFQVNTVQREILAGANFRRMQDALTTPLPVDVTSLDCLLWVCWYFVQQQADSSSQQPFRGQTDCREPSRSHGYSTYARNDIINFHLSSFFRSSYFHGSRSVHENHKNLHPVKISHQTVGSYGSIGVICSKHWTLDFKLCGACQCTLL